jgi:hypothetical protein
MAGVARVVHRRHIGKGSGRHEKVDGGEDE